MKTFNSKPALLFLSICMVILLSACCKEPQDPQPTSQNVVIEKEALPQDITMPETEIPGIPEIKTSTADLEFILSNPENFFNECPEIVVNGEIATCLSHDKKVIAFIRFVNSLNLTSEQMVRFKSITLNYWKCKKELHMILMKSNHEIIAKANEYKNELLRKFKAGQLTERQLKEAIEALKIRTKNAIENNPARQRIIESLKKCHLTYMENIKLLLNREQWAKWVAWHKNQQSGTGTKG